MKRAFLFFVVLAALYGFVSSSVFVELQALLFGINTSALTHQRLGKISKLSSDIVRLDAFSWDLIEKQKGKFDFSTTDKMVTLARRSRLQVLGILQYSPPWASGTNVSMPEKFASHCGIPDRTESYDAYRAYPPQDLSAFGTFVYTTVRRYPSIKYWQIWNEPNNPVFWKNAPNAYQYLMLLKEAYAAAKRANPDAQIVFGGLSLNDQEFMEKIYYYGGKQYFDIMAVHPYNPTQQPAEYLEFEMKKLKQFMENRNDGNKEIWITEIGWPTSTGSVSEKKQAEYIEQTYRIAGSLNFIGAVFWHTIADCPGDLKKAIDEQNYGLFRSDWSAKPGVQRYRDIQK